MGRQRPPPRTGFVVVVDAEGLGWLMQEAGEAQFSPLQCVNGCLSQNEGQGVEQKTVGMERFPGRSNRIGGRMAVRYFGGGERRLPGRQER